MVFEEVEVKAKGVNQALITQAYSLIHFKVKL
jgi:hypothetical protein